MCVVLAAWGVTACCECVYVYGVLWDLHYLSLSTMLSAVKCKHIHALFFSPNFHLINLHRAYFQKLQVLQLLKASAVRACGAGAVVLAMAGPIVP